MEVYKDITSSSSCLQLRSQTQFKIRDPLKLSIKILLCSSPLASSTMKNTPKGKTQNPLNNKKNNGFPYSPSSTLPSKPISHYKAYKTPSSSSSSSSTILKKPVPKQKGPSAASETNTNPSLSEVGWALAEGAGKLAFFVGKTAAIVTTGVVKGVVKGGMEIGRNQIEHNEKLKETERNEKLKETFSCYYTNRKKIIYQGTLYFSDNQIVFSTNHVLPTHTTSFFEKEAPNPKVEIKIPFRDVYEINQVNAENPSTRARGIQIEAVMGSYGFWGFDDYYKAYNHIYSLRYDHEY